jgi:hypothetical protein
VLIQHVAHTVLSGSNEGKKATGEGLSLGDLTFVGG